MYEKQSLLPYLDDEIFLKFVEEVLRVGFAALEKVEKNFHKNVIDPFAMLFEAGSFNLDKQHWIINEKARQAQKTLSNEVGLFHQKIIGSLTGWHDLEQSEVVDVLNTEKRIIAEIKNKYNTIKASDQIRLYKTFKNLVLLKGGKYRGYTSYYVEIIPKKPERYNVIFAPSDNTTGSRAPEHELIRRIDGASFYALATGQADALTQLYDALPQAIDICLQRQKRRTSKIDRIAFREYFIKAYGAS